MMFLCSYVYAGVNSDGVDDFIDSNYKIPLIGANEDFSWSFWYKHDALPTSEHIPWAALDDLGTDDNFGVTFLNGCDAGVRQKPAPYITNNGGFQNWCSTNRVNTTDWFHYAFSYDEDGNAIFYLNGVQENSTAPATTDNNVIDVSAVNVYFFARNRDDAAEKFSDGQMEEWCFWKGVALSAEEVLQLAGSRVRRVCLQIQPSSLERYFPLDDVADGTSADGASFRDESGNGSAAVGDDGAGNDNLIAKASEILSYP